MNYDFVCFASAKKGEIFLGTKQKQIIVVNTCVHNFVTLRKDALLCFVSLHILLTTVLNLKTKH